MKDVCTMQREWQERCRVPVVLALKKWRQEGLQLKASPEYVKACLEETRQTKETLRVERGSSYFWRL